MYNSQLKVFVCVADCGSFTKAAEELYISSTAVMKQINAFEQRIEMQLFVRTNHGVQLTAAGASVYQDAKHMIEYSDRAIQRARARAEDVYNTICVGTSMLNPCKGFIDLWYQVNDDFPGYKLHIVPFEDDHDNILHEISALGEKFDFIMGVCDSAEWLDRCNFSKLCDKKICCAVSRNHRLARKEALELSDLYGERLMMVARGDSPQNDTLRDELEQNHPQITIEDTAHYYDINVFNHCERSGGVLLTFDIWADIHPSLITLPIIWDYYVPYGVLYGLDPPDDILRIVQALKDTNSLHHHFLD